MSTHENPQTLATLLRECYRKGYERGRTIAYRDTLPEVPTADPALRAWMLGFHDAQNGQPPDRPEFKPD